MTRRPAALSASRLVPAALLALAAALLVFTGCAGFGKKPSARERAAFAASPNYDTARGVFINLREPVLDSFWAANRERFRAGIDVSANGAPPDFPLPTVRPDLAAFRSGTSGMKAIWLGHSAVALRMDSTVILLDPVFGRASPLSFYASPRFQPPPFTREDLPDVDVIVISHAHYDHLERATVEFYAQRNTTFLVPLGVGAHLRYWGVKPERVIERDWWQAATMHDVEFVATPARHSSGRTKRMTNLTQWASWVIRSGDHAVYFTGDTGYGTHFRLVGDRFGPFDAVFLENGQYSRAWRSHMQPQHWPLAMRDLKSTLWFSIHWGVFSFAPHAWDESIRAADSLATREGFTLVAPRMGETVDLEHPPALVRWWLRPDSGR